MADDPVLIAAEQIVWCEKNGVTPADIMRELGLAPQEPYKLPTWGSVFETLVRTARAHRAAAAKRMKALDAEVGRAPNVAEPKRPSLTPMEALDRPLARRRMA